YTSNIVSQHHLHNRHTQATLNTLGDLNEPLLLARQMAHPRSHIGGGGSGHLYGAHSSSGKFIQTHSKFLLGLSGLRDDEEDLDVDPRQHQLSASQHRHPQHTQQTQHYSHQSHHTLSQHHQQHA